MKKILGIKLVVLAITFGLVAASALPASADWMIRRGYGFYLVDELPGGGPGVVPAELEAKPEEQVAIPGGLHRIYVSKSKAVSEAQAALPAELGLKPEEQVAIPGGLHRIFVPKAKVR